MFDILCDVWARPGAVHSPLIPLDIISLTAENTEERLSALHKYGVDSLILTCSDTSKLNDGVLEAIFAAAKKRFMLIFVTEELMMADSGCTEDAFASYNPMMRAHTLRLSASAETKLENFEEIVASYCVKKENGTAIEAVASPEDGEDYEKYDIILTFADSGVDFISPEVCEALIYGAYEGFAAKYKEISDGALSGVVANRLRNYGTHSLVWSYDMVSEFMSLGGTPMQLLSLLTETDKRSRKEGERIYRKTLAARLDRCYLSPASMWCGKNSLAFIGEVPYDFIGTCARRFTLPVYSDECFSEVVISDGDKLTAIKCLADTARGEGFTGAAYTCVSRDADGINTEACLAVAASASLIILPSEFASVEYLESCGIRREDMRRLMFRFRRMSTLSTSCTTDASTAVLCDDGFIPFKGTERLGENGAAFNFLPLPQAIERGHSHHGEYLVDRFRYDAVLIEPRVRMEPLEIKQIGEFAVHGGKLYRGAQFGEYAKKHLVCSEFDRENYKNLLIYNTEKCSHKFTFIVNISAEPMTVSYPACDSCRAFVFDADSGKTCELLRNSADPAVYEPLRLLPGGTVTLGWDKDSEAGDGVAEVSPVREIHALRFGDNTLCLSYPEGSRAVVELDSVGGGCVDISVNGKESGRIIAKPYFADVSRLMCDGENIITLNSSADIKGAVVRIF